VPLRLGTAVLVFFLAIAIGVSSGRPLASHADRGSWLRPYAAHSVWRTPIGADPAVDPDSGARMQSWVEHNLRVRPELLVRRYAVAVVVAHRGDPRYRWGMTLRSTTGWSSNLNAFGPVPIPSGAKPDPADDGHLAIYDPVRQREWDLWRARYDAARRSWWTGGGAATSTATGSGIAPAKVTGADAANFPLLGGLVRPEELAAGVIQHALVFTQPYTAHGFVCPATHATGSTDDPVALPAGTHLQLDPAVPVATLPIKPWEKAVARALQTYGMYLRDTGGVVGIVAENPINRSSDPYARLGLGRWIIFSAGFPWDRLRILSPTC
jgi:hypothetical protein